MAKIAAISLARLSLKSIPKKKLIRITNIVIFLSIFAISAAIISIIYERKIVNLNKQLSSEYGNEVIYSHWLSEIPKNIRNVESLLSQISREHNYLIYMQGVNDKLITNRDMTHNPVIDLLRFNRFNLGATGDSLEDAVMISASVEDFNKILEYKKMYREMNNKFTKIQKENKIMVLAFPEMMQKYSDQEKKNLYDRALLAKEDLIHSLNLISTLNIKFILKFYSNKKSESQNKVSKIKKEIKIISDNESRSILIAFIIQLVIFIIIQFFEFGFELTQKIRKNKK